MSKQDVNCVCFHESQFLIDFWTPLVEFTLKDKASFLATA